MNRRTAPFAPPPILPIALGRPIPEIRALHDSLDRYDKYLQNRMNELVGPNGIINTGSQGAGTDIASADTISISDFLHNVTGTATVNTINPPAGFSAPTILFSRDGFSLGTTGNIVIPNAALVPANTYVQLVYHANVGKWKTTGLGAGPFRASSVTAHAVVVGEGTSPIAAVGPLANGQLLIGSAGADPVAADLASGSGISTTKGAGTLQVNNTGILTVTGTASQVSVTAGQNPVVSLPLTISGPTRYAGIALSTATGDALSEGHPIGAITPSFIIATFAEVTPTTFANRPPAPTQGMIASFTDSTVNTFGATIAGTGANKVLGWYNGINWTVIGI